MSRDEAHLLDILKAARLAVEFGCSHFRCDPPHAVREIRTEPRLNLRYVGLGVTT